MQIVCIFQTIFFSSTESFSRKSSFIFAQLWKCYKNSSFLLNDIWLKILSKHFCVFATVWHKQTYSSSVVLCLDGSGGRKVLRGATTTMIPSWVRSIGGLWCVLDGNQTWCLCLEWDTLYSAGVVDWWASPWFGSCPNFQSNGQWLYRHAGTRETIISSSREISTSLILSATETLDFGGKMTQGVVNKKNSDDEHILRLRHTHLALAATEWHFEDQLNNLAV